MNPAGLNMIEAEGAMEQFRGHDIFQIIHQADREKYTAMHTRVINGLAETLQYRIIGIKGNMRWMDTHAVPLLDPLSNKVQHLAITRDITVQKQAGEKLKNSENRYRHLFEWAPVAYLTVDRQGNILNANQKAVELLALALPRLLQENVSNVLILEQSEKNFLDWLSDCGLYGKDCGYKEYKIKHNDHNNIWVGISIDRISNQADANDEIRIALSNITDRKQLQQREFFRNHILELIAQGSTLNETLNAIVYSVEKESLGSLCSILLVDEKKNCLKPGAAPNLPEFYNRAINGLAIGQKVGSCGAACFSGKRVIVSDIATHPNWHSFKDIALKAELRSCWSEPILSRAGKALGAFAIYHKTVNTPTQEEIVLIENAAHLAGIVIERNVTEEALQLANTVYQNSSEAILVTDADNKIVAINPAFSNITGYAKDEVIGQEPSILNSRRHNKAFFSAMWISLKTTGQWQGEIYNRRKNGEIYTEWLTINTIYDEQEQVQQRVALFSDISDKKKNEELIWSQANYDELTGLPNRRLFYEYLSHEINNAQRNDQSLVLMFLDLDYFKNVNDTLGHEIGDKLLLEAAMRITNSVRKTDMVSRLGGDEFTILLPGQKDMHIVERIAGNINEKLKKPFHLNNEVAYVSASIGIAIYPEDAKDIDTLLKNADMAMYRAKDSGRGCFSYFTEELQINARKRQRLSNDLRDALQLGQMLLHFQPIVDLRSGKIVKAEALLRWQHPELGWVSPEEFIPLAEENGLIIGIGNWVFTTAANHLSKWRDYSEDFQISINKSPAQFKTNQDNDFWLDSLTQLNLSGNGIVIEITEGVLMETKTEILKTLLKFRDAGIEVAVDDFGTGYSSLAYLNKFDVDYLKIDKSFIDNLSEHSNDRVLSEAIIVMAHKLGLKVVAEGVETKLQENLLLQAGCDYVQGYLYSKPVSAEQFEDLFRQSLN